jgi:hypothetical protein
MSAATRIICDNIRSENLDPQDLLSIGIINDTLLQKYHKRLHDRIVKQDCLNELIWNGAEKYKVKLTIKEKNL